MKTFRKPAILLIPLAGFSFAVVACSEGAAEAVEDAKQIPAQATESTRQHTQNEKLATRKQIALSIEDLAESLSIDPTTVGFSGATPVNWRSGALGCPEPGMNYTQALVPGVLIMLKVDNTVYRYHAATGKPPFFCPDDRAEPPAFGPGAD